MTDTERTFGADEAHAAMAQLADALMGAAPAETLGDVLGRQAPEDRFQMQMAFLLAEVLKAQNRGLEEVQSVTFKPAQDGGEPKLVVTFMRR